jgi:hypothetical protein
MRKFLRTRLTFSIVFAALLTLLVFRTYLALSVGGDLPPVYMAGKALLLKQNPYDDELLRRLWISEGQSSQTGPSHGTTPMLYPPSTITAFLPLAALPWSLVCPLYYAGCIGMGVGILYLASLITGINRSSEGRLVFLVLGLLWAPLAAGIKTKQPAIPACFFLFLAIFLSGREKPIGAGISLGISAAIKPQLAGVFILYYLITRKIKVAVASLAVITLLSIPTIYFLQSNRVDWLGTWQKNLQGAAFGANNTGPANPLRFQMVNLHILLGSVFDGRQPSWLTNSITAILTASFFMSVFSLWRRRPEFPSLLALTCLTLLVTYHRFFDATILLLPLAWSLSAWKSEDGTFARIGLLLLLPFLGSGAFFLDLLKHRNRLPSQMINTWWWKGFVAPHQVWSIVLLFLLFFILMLLDGKKAGDPGGKREVKQTPAQKESLPSEL